MAIEMERILRRSRDGAREAVDVEEGAIRPVEHVDPLIFE